MEEVLGRSAELGPFEVAALLEDKTLEEVVVRSQALLAFEAMGKVVQGIVVASRESMSCSWGPLNPVLLL